MSDFFAYAMREAIAEAEKGRWTACPNPTVGAVLCKDGKILARGYHHQAGQPHAEIMCLKDAAEKGIDPKGATMAVSLEPCNHTGRTGPCSEALIKAGISQVVIGMRDPNPIACGGAERLRSAGIQVIEGVCEQECRDLVADFLTWTIKKRPFVILKLASTLDGRIATRTGQSQWVSSQEARAHVHSIRAGVGRAGGAILVGGNTFFEDNPRLTARLEGVTAQPAAYILSRRLPPKDAPFQLLQERAEQVCFLTDGYQTGYGYRTETVTDKDGKADFKRILDLVWKDGHRYLFCEGGGTLGLSLLQAGYVDLFLLHLAPKILGDAEARPLFAGRSPLHMDQALGLRLGKMTQLGPDLSLSFFPLASA